MKTKLRGFGTVAVARLVRFIGFPPSGDGWRQDRQMWWMAAVSVAAAAVSVACFLVLVFDSPIRRSLTHWLSSN